MMFLKIEPWLHIPFAYLVYIIIAVLASVVIGKVAGDLKDFSVRNSPKVLIMGGAANLIAMIAILLMLVFWDKQPISTLGLKFDRLDAIASTIGFGLTFLLAIGFLLTLKYTNRIQSLTVARPAATFKQGAGMVLGLFILATIVLQEEVLNRGYVVLNLLPLGVTGIILVSTLLFVLIHFLTNRTNFLQVISWTVSGLVLVTTYLLSGSLWVPIILHYATDAANTLVFNITGQFSFFHTTPSITENQRALFRVIYGVVIIAIFVALYGLQFRLLGA